MNMKEYRIQLQKIALDIELQEDNGCLSDITMNQLENIVSSFRVNQQTEQKRKQKAERNRTNYD